MMQEDIIEGRDDAERKTLWKRGIIQEEDVISGRDDAEDRAL